MPRRRTRDIPRWRRGRRQPPAQVIQLRGRNARRLVRDLDLGRGEAGKEGSGAAAANDVPATTGAWRYRHQMPPFAWGAGLAVFAAILHATPNPVLFGTLGGLASGALLFGFTRHLTKFARRWCDAAALLTAGWVPSLAALGLPGLPKAARILLVLTWAVPAITWMRKYRIRPEAPAAGPKVDDYERWNALADARKWDAHLGPAEALPGGGRRYPIRADGIKTVMSNILSASENVAGAWHKPMTEAFAERDPHGITSRGYLTVLGSETLMKVREWNGDGIDPQTGQARFARFADGSPAHLKFYTPRYGTRHALISGTTGSGKSELLNLIIFIALNSGMFVPVVLDPQEGQSLPFWRDRCLYAAGLDACHDMLRGLHAGMLDRSRYLASLRWEDDGIPMRGMPFFGHELTGLPMPLIIFDEAHMALKGSTKAERLIVEKTTEIGRLGRKTGTALWLATHIPSLAELGGEQALRDMLRGGNVISMRTANRVATGMLGLEKDPSEIPMFFTNGKETYGLGYTAGPDNRPDAPMRTDLVPKAMLRTVPPFPVLDDRFLEAMDRAMGVQGVLIPAAAAPSAFAGQPEPPADDGPEGRRCIDAVWQVLAGGGEMERGQVIKEVGELVTAQPPAGWGRDKSFSIRSIQIALTELAGGNVPGRPVMKPRDKVYEALAPRSEIAANDQARGGV